MTRPEMARLRPVREEVQGRYWTPDASDDRRVRVMGYSNRTLRLGDLGKIEEDGNGTVGTVRETGERVPLAGRSFVELVFVR